MILTINFILSIENYIITKLEYKNLLNILRLKLMLELHVKEHVMPYIVFYQ
jgi:hypothetical protein